MVTANWRGCDVVHETTKPITAPFKQPAAGAGVELDATAVIARATVAGIRIALIIDTYQRFRFVVVNIFTSICVHLLTIKCPQIFRHTNVIVSYLQCNKVKQLYLARRLHHHYKFLPIWALSFIMGLHRPNKFLPISPGSRGVVDRANVEALLFGRARDPTVTSLCTGAHARQRPGG